MLHIDTFAYPLGDALTDAGLLANTSSLAWEIF